MSSIKPGIPSAPSEILADEYLGRRVAKSAAWMVMKRFTFKAIGLISTLILVRLLVPEAVGLAAIGSVAYDVLDAMTEFSFALALVKMTKPERAHFDTAWTLIVMRGFFIGGLMLLGAPWIADFMRDPRLVDLTRVLALLPVLQGFENVGLIEFQRDLKFERIFWYEVLGKMIGFVLVIPAAMILHNAWALVIGMLGPKLITIPASYLMHPHRPRFSLKVASELLDFSKWLFATNLMTLVKDYMMVLLLGRVGGAGTVGLYQQAYQIGALPVSEVAAPMRRPMYSGYAKLLDDRERLKRHVVDGLALILMIITPMSIGIALTAGLIEPVALGPNWKGAGPLIQLCALYALFEGVGEFTHDLYVVQDRQRRFVEIMSATVILRAGIVIWAAFTYGVVWAAAAMALNSLFSSAVLYGELSRAIGLSLGRTIRATWRTGAATLAMAAGVLYLQWIWPQSPRVPGMLGQLALESLTGAVLYVATLLGLWWASGSPDGPEAQAVALLRQVVRSRLPGRRFGDGDASVAARSGTAE